MVGMKYFLYMCSTERNMGLKYIHRAYFIFSYLSKKEKSFHFCSRCNYLPCPIYLGLPLPSPSCYAGLILDSLAVWHCQPRYWICILFTLSQSLLKASNKIYLFFLIFLPVLGHRSLISASIFMAKTSVNIFSKLFHVC